MNTKRVEPRAATNPPVTRERPARGTARVRILDAAVGAIRRQGLAATTVDDLCAAAGVTKGAFFHHFAGKEALAVAAAEHWTATTEALFAQADFHNRPTPTERVLAYLDLRAALIQGTPAEFTCLAGTMAQEAFETQPAVRRACADNMLGHASTLEPDLAQALRDAGRGDIDAAELARYVVAVTQGAFVLAKAGDDPELARDTLAHLRRYLSMLFAPGQPSDVPAP